MPSYSRHNLNASRRLRRRCRPERRGAVTLWTILTIPALMLLVCVILEIGNLWYARVQLETGLEAAALAAVKEWGDNPTLSSTLRARCTGVEYARVNNVGGKALSLTSNHGTATATNPNQNANCQGNLIFGAIVTGNQRPPYVFDTRETPGCGGGTVLFDASGQGNLTLEGAWGIAFYNTTNTDPALRITQIVIDLRASGGIGQFVGTPTISTSASPVITGQPDVAGFTDTTSDDQIDFDLTNVAIGILTIDFPLTDPDDTAYDGFAPCYRFRFGMDVTGVADTGPGSGSTTNDGDGIGADGTGVTVTFSDSTSVSAVFRDTNEKSNQCTTPAAETTVTCPGALVTHPAGHHSLPCPPGSAAKNNGQSYVFVNGGSGSDAFGVRAQATVSVTPFCQSMFGLPLPDLRVHAKTTAMYDCADETPRLIRLEEYICQ